MNDTFEVALILGEVTEERGLRQQHFTHDIKMYSTPKSTLTVTDPTRTEEAEED